MKRYKVLRITPYLGCFRSIFADQSLMAGYKVGKWCSPVKGAIKAGYGPLVFTDIARVPSMLDRPDLVVARVHCRRKMKLPFKVRVGLSYILDLQALVKGDPNYRSETWPDDTEMYESIKIVEIASAEITRKLYTFYYSTGLYGLIRRPLYKSIHKATKGF